MRDDDLQQLLADLENAGRLRTLPAEAAPVINLQSNDYLAIAQNPAHYQAFLEQWQPAGPSGSASRLLGGNAASAAACEQAAEHYWGMPALYYNSGYHANIGILPALTGRQDLIIGDKDIHASLIDGARLSAAKLLRYPHQDLEQLDRLLEKQRGSCRSVWIVTESVFSMDGSLTDLAALREIATRRGCRLYIDEAHAAGIYGEGRGRAFEAGITADILVLPLAKAMASFGALVFAPELIKNALVNTSRSLIFASALPPVVTAWTQYVIEHLPEFAGARQKLLSASRALQQGLDFAQVIDTPIIPVILGDEQRTMTAAAKLRQAGIAVGAVRHPTVPLGKAQLRLCAHAGLSEADIAAVIAAIRDAA